jgi:hypothetical protein
MPLKAQTEGAVRQNQNYARDMHSPTVVHVFTLEEAAAALRICTKTLATFLKKRPADPPLYARAGCLSDEDRRRV